MATVKPRSHDRLVIVMALLGAVGCETRRNVLTSIVPGDGGPLGRDGAAGAGEDGGASAPGVLGLGIRLQEVVRPISRRIYGLSWRPNAPDPTPTDRPGHIVFDSFWASTYNWENNAGNGGATWCFENGAPFGGGGEPGAGVLALIEQARSFMSDAIVTVPLLDHVAADTMGGIGPPECTGDVRRNANYLESRFRRNLPRKNRPFVFPPDREDDAVYQDEFAAWLRGARKGQPLTFVLDHFPERWVGVHSHLHPDPLTYAEMATRNIDFGAALKAGFPEAEVIGSIVTGWNGIMYLNGAPDMNRGRFVEYYLDRLRAAEAAAGVRVVDHFNLDWSPVLPAGSMGPEVVLEARLQAPRSLWDGNYVERSWIGEQLQGPIRLIPRLRELIAERYPGAGLAFMSWNFGAGDEIAGALVAADVLGVFGREGVAAATLDVNPREARFALAGHRVFRNFDGQGRGFGDLALATSNPDARALSIYASARSDDRDDVVVMVINKQPVSQAVELRLDGEPRFEVATVHRVTAAAAGPVREAEPLGTAVPNQFADTVPAYSITVYDLAR